MMAITRDALAIIDACLFSQPDPAREVRMRAYDLALEVAQVIYDLRAETGLDQAAFAERVGRTAQEIADLEDADFPGDPVDVLHTIAATLGHRVTLSVTPKQAA